MKELIKIYQFQSLLQEQLVTAGLAVNSGQQSAKGVEVTLNLVPVQTEDLRWDVSLNYAQNKKYVDALAEGIERRVLDSWMSWGGLQTQEVVGEEWGLIVGRKKARDANGTQIVTTKLVELHLKQIKF